MNHALSTYVDHRLGMFDGEPVGADKAESLTAQVFGNTEARNARVICGEPPREEKPDKK